MYYLKCPNCGFLNPFRTEFLTFCGSCGKKLHPNYPDWIRDHPGKTIREFRDQYCTQTGLPANTSAPRRRDLRILLWTGAGLAVFLILFLVSGRSGFRIFPDETPQSVISGNWVKFTYGKYGLSVETPERLTKRNVVPTASHEQYIFDMESFSYDSERGFGVVISSIVYREGTRVNLQGAANEAVNELFRQPGISQVEFTQSPISYNDVRGMLLEGTYYERDVFSRFECAVYVRKSNLWQVFVTYRANDHNGKKAAERVMGSIEINYYVRNI
jgi:hypothetical protein